MKKTLKQASICATISLLFVLAVFAQRAVGLLGPETAKVALVTAAVAPPVEVALKDGPIFPPDPVDIPSLVARGKDGPIFPPDPVDIPSLKDGPIFPPDPVDIPSRS